jgi:hypothetical protein
MFLCLLFLIFSKFTFSAALLDILSVLALFGHISPDQ